MPLADTHHETWQTWKDYKYSLSFSLLHTLSLTLTLSLSLFFLSHIFASHSWMLGAWDSSSPSSPIVFENASFIEEHLWLEARELTHFRFFV